MAVQHNQDSEYAKEMVKWEAQHTPLGPGLRPYVRREFPQMVYKASRIDGSISFEHQLVESDVQFDNMRSRGWCPDPAQAQQELEVSLREIAKHAANLEYQKERVSPQARAEIEAAQDAHSGHLPSVPETPIRPRASK